MEHEIVVGVDLGGTNVQTVRLGNMKIEKSFSREISAQAESDIVLNQLKQAIDNALNDNVTAIGVGVPGLVDLNNGVVYDMVNIPSWKKIPLQSILEKEYNIPVFINNDANCFALSECYFGAGKNFDNLVGLIIGTGLGAGIIFDNKIYSGANCGAGEFGMLPYLEHNYEYYASGQFFKNIYQASGKDVFYLAQQGQTQALKIFEEFGTHLGKAIAAVFYTIDPEIIILGGSVSKAYPFFKEAMERSLAQVEYQTAVRKLKVVVSKEKYSPVLGAAALAFESSHL